MSNGWRRPGDDDARLLLADRTHHYGAPVSVLFSALISDQQHWMRLAPGEVLTVQIIESAIWGGEELLDWMKRNEDVWRA